MAGKTLKNRNRKRVRQSDSVAPLLACRAFVRERGIAQEKMCTAEAFHATWAQKWHDGPTMALVVLSRRLAEDAPPQVPSDFAAIMGQKLPGIQQLKLEPLNPSHELVGGLP